jgi:hypothetical protein
MTVATIEAQADGTKAIALTPPKGLALWAVIPIGATLLGFALMFSGRCFEGLLVAFVGAVTSVVWARLALRKERWVLSAGQAVRYRDFLGLKSEHVFAGVTKVLGKKYTDDDQRRILEVGIESAQGWTRVGESLDHDDAAEAFARALATALGVPAEIPPRA